MVRPSTLFTVLSATRAAAYTPNKPGSEARYPFNKPYEQSFTEGYNLLNFLGGLGPYKNRNAYGIGRDPPDGCAVDQVIMLHRVRDLHVGFEKSSLNRLHGERYPDPSTAKTFNAVLAKMDSANITFKDDLAFLNSWTSFLDDAGEWALESYAGPYSGLLQAYTNGIDYRARYGHLWDGNSSIPIFSSGYERIIQTARKFGEGFLGWNYSTVAAVNIISENATQGANSLTPTCDVDNSTSVCDTITRNFDFPAFRVAAARLNAQNPGLSLGWSSILYLMMMTAFEINARGYSEWANVWTLDEWTTYEYCMDLDYYYCAGPGDKNMKAVGSVYANATLLLLNQGPEEAGPMFWSFSHDTNITPVLAALGISSPDEDLPLDHIPWGNKYRVTDIVPMGGHFVLERLSCSATAATAADTYVRVVLNEAVVPFDDCQDGPGFSCSLSDYTTLVNSKLVDYVSTCSVPADYPQHLDFYWNYNSSTALNYEPQQYIPYQQGYTTI